MTDTTDTDSGTDEAALCDESRDAVVRALTKYGDVGVDERDGGATQVIDRSDGEVADGSPADVFEVLVDAVGRLNLDEVMENQGLLIYCRDGIEVELSGFVDRQVLVEVTQKREKQED